MTETFYKITTIENEFNISLDCEEDRDMLLSFFRTSVENKTAHPMFLKTNSLMPYHAHETSEIVVLLRGTLRYIENNFFESCAINKKVRDDGNYTGKAGNLFDW